MSAMPAATAFQLPAGVSNRDYALLWYLGLQRHILSDSRFAPLIPLFRGDAARMMDFDYVRGMHFSAMRRIARTLNGHILRLTLAAIAEYVEDVLGVPPVAPAPDNGFAARLAGELDSTGHVMLPPITARQVADMRAHFADKPVHAGLYAAEGTLAALDAIGDANIANYPASTVLTCPHVTEIASDPLILSVVSRHLGTVPVILGYTAWWSFAGRAEARDAQLFHLDNADYAFCKLFIQLTDVDLDGGPHAFMPRSHDADHVATLRAAWPEGPKAFDDWFFMTLRKTDAETLHYLGGGPDYITGPAGSCFLANTRGIHKGLLPRQRDRLVCQVVYGVSPSMQPSLMKEGVFPLSRAARLPDVPARLLAAPPGDYVHRLFLVP